MRLMSGVGSVTRNAAVTDPAVAYLLIGVRAVLINCFASRWPRKRERR